MNSVLVVLVVIVVIVGAVALAVVGAFNKFARQRNTIEESWRQVDVELQRRHDLIGNLVETTRAAARFEQGTIVAVTQARAAAVAAHGAGPARQGQTERQLNGALAGFFQVAESYPDLKSDNQFLYLQQQLVECEDRVAAGRRFYNGNVRAYNTRFDTFPSSLVAGKFQKADYYEVDDPTVRAAPSLGGAFDSLGGNPGGNLGGNPGGPAGQIPPGR